MQSGRLERLLHLKTLKEIYFFLHIYSNSTSSVIDDGQWQKAKIALT